MIFIKYIFYIPCLFIDIIDFIRYQLKITTKLWLILIIQIILILLRIFIPYLYGLYKKYMLPVNSVIIEEGPIYLITKTVGVFQNLNDIDSVRNIILLSHVDYGPNPRPSSTSEAIIKKLHYLIMVTWNIYHYNNKIQIYAATTNKKFN